MTAGSGFAISEEVLNIIKEHLPLGKTILEFGSGTGTHMLTGAGYKMVSVEQDFRFVNYSSNVSDMIFAPIDPATNWYNMSIVNAAIQNLEYDAILIDGPGPGDRFGIINSKVDLTKLMFVDDIDRPYDRELFDVLSKVGEREVIDHEFFGVIK
jgi:hypothetical protein